jgi:hypothetical protein
VVWNISQITDTKPNLLGDQSTVAHHPVRVVRHVLAASVADRCDSAIRAGCDGLYCKGK